MPSPPCDETQWNGNGVGSHKWGFWEAGSSICDKQQRATKKSTGNLDSPSHNWDATDWALLLGRSFPQVPAVHIRNDAFGQVQNKMSVQATVSEATFCGIPSKAS
eukprot:gene10492-biopygen15338